MRKRPSSRLLVIDPSGKVLLFRFAHERGPLEGQDFWATPGGALEVNETFEQAAVRELREETGIEVSTPGTQVHRREFVLQLPDGEYVAADERYFVIEVADSAVSRGGWTDLEREVMTDCKWWSVAELERTADTVWPNDLATLLRLRLRELRLDSCCADAIVIADVFSKKTPQTPIPLSRHVRSD